MKLSEKRGGLFKAFPLLNNGRNGDRIEKMLKRKRSEAVVDIESRPEFGKTGVNL
jgi:hypothetical protein